MGEKLISIQWSQWGSQRFFIESWNSGWLGNVREDQRHFQCRERWAEPWNKISEGQTPYHLRSILKVFARIDLSYILWFDHVKTKTTTTTIPKLVFHCDASLTVTLWHIIFRKCAQCINCGQYVCYLMLHKVIDGSSWSLEPHAVIKKHAAIKLMTSQPIAFLCHFFFQHFNCKHIYCRSILKLKPCSIRLVLLDFAFVSK